MTRERLSVGRLLTNPTTQRMSKIEFDNADYIESCMVFKNFTSLDNGRSREFVAKFNSPDEAKDFIKNYNQIYNDHEAQLKAKDEEIERLKADINKMKCCENCEFEPNFECSFNTQYGCLDDVVPLNWKVKGNKNV